MMGFTLEPPPGINEFSGGTIAFQLQNCNHSCRGAPDPALRTVNRLALNDFSKNTKTRQRYGKWSYEPSREFRRLKI